LETISRFFIVWRRAAAQSSFIFIRLGDSHDLCSLEGNVLLLGWPSACETGEKVESRVEGPNGDR
jgi:hypothetical protein